MVSHFDLPFFYALVAAERPNGRSGILRCTTLRVVSREETSSWLRPQPFPAESRGLGHMVFLGFPQPLAQRMSRQNSGLNSDWTKCLQLLLKT